MQDMINDMLLFFFVPDENEKEKHSYFEDNE